MQHALLCDGRIPLVQTDPTRFVSGGDDCTVRLWSIREEAPVAVIDAKANVCSVQFSPVSSNLLAFGSANYRVYLYDLRQMRVTPSASPMMLRPALAPPGQLLSLRCLS